MKFSNIWADVLTQNNVLRFVILTLSLCLLFFGIATVRLSPKAPLIVERGCISRTLAVASTTHTDEEVKAFLHEALSRRFDSGAKDIDLLLSKEEASFRAMEQEELLEKGMKQKIILNSITLKGSLALVDADRLISVKNVRSALSFPLEAELSSTDRTEANPYGLILQRVSQIKVEEDGHAAE